jgi:hypothetical protein
MPQTAPGFAGGVSGDTTTNNHVAPYIGVLQTLQTVSLSRATPSEFLVSESRSAVVPDEETGGLNRSLLAVTEALGEPSRITVVPDESLVSESRSLVAPNESRGTTARTSAAPDESLGSETRTTVAPDESSGQPLRTWSVPDESLGSITRQLVVPDEELAAQVVTALGRIEAMAAAGATDSAMLEALGSPLHSILVMAESLADYSSETGAPIEIEMSIFAGGSQITTASFPPRIRISVAAKGGRDRIVEHPTTARVTVAPKRVTITSPTPRIRRVIITRGAALMGVRVPAAPPPPAPPPAPPVSPVPSHVWSQRVQPSGLSAFPADPPLLLTAPTIIDIDRIIDPGGTATVFGGLIDNTKIVSFVAESLATSVFFTTPGQSINLSPARALGWHNLMPPSSANPITMPITLIVVDNTANPTRDTIFRMSVLVMP